MWSLTSENLVIRNVLVEDCETIVTWKDQELMREMSIGASTAITLENQKEDIERSIARETPYFIIELKEGNRPIGYIRIDWMDQEKKIGWLRFGLGEMRGHGYSEEALRCVIAHFFQSGVHRIDGEVYDFNPASARVLKKLGFRLEGIRRKAIWSKGEYHDILAFGLLAKETGDRLGEHVEEYRRQLEKGSIQKAYRGIMSFMTSLKSQMEAEHPECGASGLYFGYMDMTYFAFTPSVLKDRKLKIAVVYLHEADRFEVWLCGINRKVQANHIELLKGKDLNGYKLSTVASGVDSIIGETIWENPDFDDLDVLKKDIKEKTISFISDMAKLV